MKRAAALMLVALTAAIGCDSAPDGPPAIEVDRSACAHCGMLISEPRFAAARLRQGFGEASPHRQGFGEASPHRQGFGGASPHRQGSGGAGAEQPTEALLFDDIGCLLGSLPEGADTSSIRFWFKDVNTGEWIDGDGAVFVRSAGLRTPMAGGIVAYGNRAAAARGAVDHEGRVIGALDDLVKEHRGGGEL